jgi:hypothetical protein
MSGIQTIIDNATYITIDDQRITGSSISRSGQYKTAERGPSPYAFTVGMHNGLKYSTNRALLSELNTLGKTVEANISLNNNTNMNYLTAYQGDIEQAQLNNITLNSVYGSEIYVDCSGATGSGILFKKGDYIQPKGNTDTYRYPYQVTSDVTFSTGANVTIPVSRPVLSQTGVALTSGGIKVGNDVRFQVKCVTQPTYSVVPHDLISFSADFELIEVIT